MEKLINTNDITLLQRAEELHKKKRSVSESKLSEFDTLKLIHELEVHQIELEMQNEEVMLSKNQAELATEKYAELYDFAPSGYFTLSEKGNIIDLNLSGSEMLGKERSHLKNRSFNFFVSNDTRPIFNHFLGKVFKSKAKETCEVTLSTIGNLPMQVLLTGIATKNGEQCLVTIIEIIERKRAEQELIIANKELVFQNGEKEKRAAELVIADKELAFQNDEKEKRADELIIANKELVFQNGEKEKRAVELVIADKELVFQNEEKEKRADELIIANKELAFQKEEKKKRAAELIIADKELTFQSKEKGNRAAELIIANKELIFQNEEKEKRAAELIIANKELVFQNEEKEKRAAELIIANKELVFQNEEKEKRAAELIIANKELTFQNEEKEKRAAELIIANKELAYQNREKEKRAAELVNANKEMEAFSYSVSHDLSAPLRHINGYVELLLIRFYDFLPDKARHYLNNIADSVSQMATLIDDLLQFSRTGLQEMLFADLNMNIIVQEVLVPIKQENHERNIEWRIATLPHVYGDHAMLRLVWTNLLSNAVKFTRTRGKTIIEINVIDENDAFIFSIRDNGVGFDMQYAQKLFGVFQRLHTNDEFEGTGIGLANVHRIILKHGGHIWAEAEPDKGATFNFSLPKNKED